MSTENMILLGIALFAAYKIGEQQAINAAKAKAAAIDTTPLDRYAFLGWQG